jgi:hypothetical protein
VNASTAAGVWVDISAIVALAPVVPVLTIERTADAVPLAGRW